MRFPPRFHTRPRTGLFSVSVEPSDLLVSITQYLEMSLRSLLATTETERLSGCTCTLVFLHDNQLTVCNLGDTQFVWSLTTI